MMKKILARSLSVFSILMMTISLSLLPTLSAQAEEASQAGESAQILQDFNKQHRDAEHEKSISDKTKQRVMFSLGIILLTMVLITGALGLAMGLYGKPVFVAHMVFAALSVVLGIAHAIVGLVWFYPF
jgi:hypothetical protein